MNTLDKEYVSITTAQLKQVVNNPEIADYVNTINAQKSRYYTQSLYMLAFNFDTYLSRFREEDLERKALYITTSEDGSRIGTFEMDFKELVINSDKHGRISDISKVRLQDKGRKTLEESGLFNKDHLNEAKAAYEGTYQRLQRY